MHQLRKFVTLLLLVGLLPCEVEELHAGLVINLGDFEIPPGATTHEVEVMITGGDAVTDMVAYFQVGDGGPLFGGTAGPKIASIDLSGSIWSTAASGFGRVDSLSYPTQFQELSVSLNSSGETVAGSGRLCRLILDTTGFSGKHSLKMSQTIGGDTTFMNGAVTVPVTITDGNPIEPLAPVVGIQRLAGGVVQLSIPSQAGFKYTIEWDNDLVPPWTRLPSTTMPGNDGVILWSDDGSLTGSLPSTALTRFYRVVVEPNP